MKPFLIILTSVLSSLIAKAQFDGLNSYFTDPLMQQKIKTTRVRTVSALEVRTTYTAFGGSYTFDTLGRVIDMYNASYKRHRREYDERGLIAKVTSYDDKDSSKVAYWTSTGYSRNGTVIKEVQGAYNAEGKPVLTKTMDYKTIQGTDGKSSIEIYRYFGDKIMETTYSRDSVSGIYDFTFNFEYDREGPDEKGLRHGKRTVIREYKKDNCFYTDEIRYRVYGRIETPDKIEGRYHLTDTKGRLLEYGEIDYEAAMEAYFNAHPEDFNMYTIPTAFANGILNNNISGKRKPNEKCVYDANGRLIKKTSYSTDYTFIYNARGQVIKQIAVGLNNRTDTLYYNEKGLVSRLVSEETNPNYNTGKKEVSEQTFTYTYY